MKIKFNEIAAKTEAQLKKELQEFYDELHELRQKAHAQELKTFHKISHVRKGIARHLTAIKQKSQ